MRRALGGRNVAVEALRPELPTPAVAALVGGVQAASDAIGRLAVERARLVTVEAREGVVLTLQVGRVALLACREPHCQNRPALPACSDSVPPVYPALKAS